MNIAFALFDRYDTAALRGGVRPGSYSPRDAELVGGPSVKAMHPSRQLVLPGSLPTPTSSPSLLAEHRIENKGVRNPLQKPDRSKEMERILTYLRQAIDTDASMNNGSDSQILEAAELAGRIATKYVSSARRQASDNPSGL